MALLCPLCRLRNLTLLPFARASAMISGCVANRFSLGNDLLIRQQISQYDLAAMVGGGREYVARTLSNWQDRKLVSRRRLAVIALRIRRYSSLKLSIDKSAA